MSWKKRDIVKPIPKEIKALVSEASALAATLGPILSAVSSLITAAQAFYTATTDPYSTLASGMLSEANNLNNNFFSTGVYYLTIQGDKIPGKVSYDQYGIPLMTPSQAIDAAIASFDDVNDPARPVFANSAQVCMVGFLATAPTSAQLLTQVNGLAELLGLPDWRLFRNRIQRRTQVTTPPTEPDWRSWRLNSIENMRQAQKLVKETISYLNGYSVTPDTNLTDLANIVTGKLNALNALSSKLSTFASNVGSVSGLYMVNQPIAVGGNNLLKAVIYDCPLERFKYDYTIMTLIVGGGPSLQTVDNFRKLVL